MRSKVERVYHTDDKETIEAWQDKTWIRLMNT